MNIMINSYCNLKCPYCFADNEITTCDDKNMKMEDFDVALEVCKRNGLRTVRIIGGEPTIHPYFGAFLNKVVEDDFFESVHFFSNMTFGEETLEMILMINDIKRVSILPNFNADHITKNKAETIRKNIKILSNEGVIDSIGINLYDDKMDLTYFFDLIKETKVKAVRWAITSPNYNVDKNFDVKSHFNKFYNKLIEFFDLCIENKCEPRLDCSDIPVCCFTAEQQSQLLLRNPMMFTKTPCDVVIDVNPKMEVFRCFGMSNSYKTKLKATSKLKTVANLIRENTKKQVDNLLFKECINCPKYKKHGRSCACVVYRENNGDFNE